MAKKTFEASLSRLEEITEELEKGELNLETSLKRFEEGIGLVRLCNDQLNEARAKVELLLNKNGNIEAVPFNEASREHQKLPE